MVSRLFYEFVFSIWNEIFRIILLNTLVLLCPLKNLDQALHSIYRSLNHGSFEQLWWHHLFTATFSPLLFEMGQGSGQSTPWCFFHRFTCSPRHPIYHTHNFFLPWDMVSARPHVQEKYPIYFNFILVSVVRSSLNVPNVARTWSWQVSP